MLPRIFIIFCYKVNYFSEKTLVLDLDETLVHSSLQFVPDADIQFDLKVPEVGWRTVYVKVNIKYFPSKYLSTEDC